MKTKELKPKKALNKAFLKVKPSRSDIEKFKTNLIDLLQSINDSESEEFHKNLVIAFLKQTYYDPNHFINTKGKNDLVIHIGKTAESSVGVIFEAKKPTNKAEMISKDNINKKAFHELVLYYLRERITHKNDAVKYLIATNINEWFVFDVAVFDRLFAQSRFFVEKFTDFENGRLADTKTEFFYKVVAEPFISEIHPEIEFTYFNLQDYKEPLYNQDKDDDSKLIPLFKLFSPEHLLKIPFQNDSNSLDKRFYSELLHIIGLTEIKDGSKKLIERNKPSERNTGSILEDAIIQLDSLDKISRLDKPSHFGNTTQERLFNIALELTITWINRILFLKLLEAQLITYHKGNKSYSFLNIERIKSYDDLNSLFFQVLARKYDERNEDVKKAFEKVPYLNSSLFEPTDLEQVTLIISNLRDDKKMPIFSQTVLKDSQGKKKRGNISSIEYIFEFLNAYDFSSEGSGEIQEDNKILINASVLGLIFEKINGYKDGSFFTPGFITMYMCRETIRKAVVQKFNEIKNWKCENFSELYNKIEDRKEANVIVNSIKICDPAVGSGHFLVSALNEIIAVKNDLKILQDRQGRRLKEYNVEVVNDELFVTDEDDELFEYNPMNKESQRIQETLFHEKQTIIENCLFGVDINPNSVKICRLRLWIELLKNAYYKNVMELETLPNIDINIKCGNSLVSRFAIDSDLKQALKKSKRTIGSYKIAVDTYRNAENKEQKWEMKKLIEDIKSDFRSEISSNDPEVKKLQKLSEELFQLTKQTRLFEMSKKEEADWNRKVKQLRDEVEELKTKIEEIKANKIFENAFEWRFEFPEVLDENGDFVGFDVVIGNPPYGFLFNELEKRFIKTFYQYTDYQFDVYMTFFERSYFLLKNYGNLCFIAPNTWLLNLKTPNIRKLLFTKFNTAKIRAYDFHVFEEAIVDTAIVNSEKSDVDGKPFNVQIINKIGVLIENVFSKRKLADNFKAPLNIYLSNKALIISNKFAPLKKIDEVAKITQGTKPFQKGKGKPRQDEKILKEKPYVQTFKKDDTFRPLLRGSLINRYITCWNNNYYISFGDWLAEPRYSANYDAPLKIVIRQTGSSLIATIDKKQFVVRDNLYTIISTDKKYSEYLLLACLNSELINWYYQNIINNEVGEALAQVKRGHLEILPVPNFNLNLFAKIENAVKLMLEIKENQDECGSRIANLETEIDNLVYQLYDLTPREIGDRNCKKQVMEKSNMNTNDSIFNELGYEIPGFEVVKHLGQGISGHVFLMREKSQVGLVRAVKVLNPFPTMDINIAEKRFNKEAECLLRLQHTSIVRYILSGISSDKSKSKYLVMEYVEGEKVLEFAKTKNSIEKAKIVVGILQALSYSHSQGVFHRDIKSSNVIVRNSDNVPVIVDFGLSYILDEITAQTITTTAVGSLGYIPPEVINDPKIKSPQHDIFSCGALLYRLFAPKTPNVQEYERLSSIDKNLAGLDLIIQKAIASQKDRFLSSDEFIKKLLNWIEIEENKKGTSYDNSDFLTKLIKRKNEADNRQAELKVQEEKIASLSLQAHSVVFAAAEIVFSSIADALSTVCDFYKLEGPFEDDAKEKIRTLSLYSINNNNNKIKDIYSIISEKYNYKMAIGSVKIGNGQNEMKREELIPLIKKSYPQKSVNLPRNILTTGWVLYQQSSNQSPNIINHISIIASYKLDEISYPITFYIYDRSFRSKNDLIVAKNTNEIAVCLKKSLEEHFAN